MHRLIDAIFRDRPANGGENNGNRNVTEVWTRTLDRTKVGSAYRWCCAKRASLLFFILPLSKPVLPGALIYQHTCWLCKMADFADLWGKIQNFLSIILYNLLARGRQVLQSPESLFQSCIFTYKQTLRTNRTNRARTNKQNEQIFCAFDAFAVFSQFPDVCAICHLSFSHFKLSADWYVSWYFTVLSSERKYSR